MKRWSYSTPTATNLEQALLVLVEIVYLLKNAFCHYQPWANYKEM